MFDHLLSSIGDRSIIVYTSYRTGSTALCDYLGRILDAENFDEAFHPNHPHRPNVRNQFREHLENNNRRFVVKIMGSHINGQNKEEIDAIWEKCFVIRLARRDLAEQAVSMAISGHTRRWHVKEGEQVGEYHADIQSAMLKKHVQDIRRHAELIATTERRIDADVWYEDLDLRGSNYIPRRRPDNYQELLRAARRMLEDKI